MAGTMAMRTVGGGWQAMIGQVRQPGGGGAGAHRHGTPVGAGPPRLEYSGMGTYLDKFGPSILDPGTVISMLQWQKDVNKGDAACINAFKAEVGSFLTFQAFLMMRESSAMVTVLHSLAKYFAIIAATSQYQDGSTGLWEIDYQRGSRVRSSSKQPRVGSGSGNL